MTTREQLIIEYYKPTMNLAYDYEADFLKETKTLLSMLEKCKVVREAAATINGTADLLACYRGRFIALELKAEDGTPTPHQLKFIADVIDAGGLGAVCTTVREVITLMIQA